MSGKEPECSSSECPKATDVTGSPKAATRFRAYRLVVEYRERKLKENETVIDRLKDELKSSRETEKCLINQMRSAQDRIVGLQNCLKNFINVSERQRENEVVFEKFERILEELGEKINKARKESKNLFKNASKEADLLKKIKELESALAEKNTEHDLMKMEIQALTKEQKVLEAQFQETVGNLEKELGKWKRKETEMQGHCREAELYYKQQLRSYEEKIARYEKERRSYLEDFEPPQFSETTRNSFAWADGTVTINAEEKPLKTSSAVGWNESVEDEAFVQQSSRLAREQRISDWRKGKQENLSGAATKRKPQLEFLTSQDPSQGVKAADGGRKRRLFSTNQNHYVD